MNRRSTVYFLIISLLIILAYQSVHFYQPIHAINTLRSIILTEEQRQYPNRRRNNNIITLQRRSHCNSRNRETCYSTNKSLVISFWGKTSVDKWVSQNILSAFPFHSFDHIIFVHDNSSWHSHPGHKHFIWIHVAGQHRLWYLKRFVSPMIAGTYQFLWIIDDDAQLHFKPLQYQCVVKNLSIALSAPARFKGVASHALTKKNDRFSKQIGRWTDFIETGPIVVVSSLAWNYVHTYIDASTGTGWGLDMIWCNMLVEQCSPYSELQKACAILDAFDVDHQSSGINSVADGAPELDIYTQPYARWLTKKKPSTH